MGPQSQNIRCRPVLLSVNQAFCLTFSHSIFVFHSFICSLIHSTSKDIKQTILSDPVSWLSGHLAAWPGEGGAGEGNKRGGWARRDDGEEWKGCPIPYFFLSLSK